MTCQHPGCLLEIFSSCTNHCMQNVCLEHLIEHGDLLLSDFIELVNHLDKSAFILAKEANIAANQIIQRRQNEIKRINHKYDKEQHSIRKQFVFAENAYALLNEKQNKLIKSKQTHLCHINQYDVEQLKSYENHIQHYLFDQPGKQEDMDMSDSDVNQNSNTILVSTHRTFSCPLTQPNVFGLKLEHHIRFDCHGASFKKYNLTKHFEGFHAMLPECALRLTNAVIVGQSADQTKLFSDHEVVYNQDIYVPCPLTDINHIFGAKISLSALTNIPCTKKQIKLPSLIIHFQLYHNMKHDASKKIYNAIKNRSLHRDLMLFDENEIISAKSKKK